MNGRWVMTIFYAVAVFIVWVVVKTFRRKDNPVDFLYKPSEIKKNPLGSLIWFILAFLVAFLFCIFLELTGLRRGGPYKPTPISQIPAKLPHIIIVSLVTILGFYSVYFLRNQFDRSKQSRIRLIVWLAIIFIILVIFAIFLGNIILFFS